MMSSETIGTVILAGSVVLFTYVLLFLVGRKPRAQTASTKEQPKESCPYLESISKVDENGDTKFMIACGEGNLQEVQKLLQSGTKNSHSSISTTATGTKGKCPFQFGNAVGADDINTTQMT